MQVPPLVETLLRDWILYLAMGVAAGGLANILFPEKRFGVFADCAAGWAGSIAGGCLAWVWNDYFRPGSYVLILSLFGSLMFITILRKLQRGT